MMATKGEVLVNGTNVKEYTEEGLRNKIGIVHKKQFYLKEQLEVIFYGEMRVQQKMI